MTDVPEALVERAAGQRPSRTRAVFAAAAVGMGAAVLTYRLLRSGGAPDDR